MIIRLGAAGFESRLMMFGRARFLALEQLVTVHCIAGDLRWALAELVLRSIRAALVSGRARVGSRIRRLAKRGRFASQHAPAATMLAAGGR